MASRTYFGTPAWVLTLSLVTGLGPSRASSPDPSQPKAPDTRVIVYLAHRCPMAHSVWKSAQATVIQLFRQIGVRLEFSGTMPDLSDTRTVSLLVLDRTPKNVSPHVLGTATSDPTFGPVVFVFFDRLQQFHEYAYMEDRGVVLGYAIAHELGHVLRDEPSHSASGVMKAYWNHKDAEAMIRHSVTFTSYDSDRIHRVLAAQPTLRNALASQH